MQSLETASTKKAKRTDGGKWVETALGIMYVRDDRVQFVDDWDHWRNGFCRLLEIDEDKAKRFVEETVSQARHLLGKPYHELSEPNKLRCLKEATTKILYGGQRPKQPPMQESWGTDLQGGKPDTVYAQSISGNPDRIVVGNSKNEFAWLIDPKTNKKVTADSIVYDTQYFGSEGKAHYGMKHYSAQTGWRLEKARRFTKTMLENLGDSRDAWLESPAKINIMDVGSGIGYFRKAYDEQGLKHYGIDLSADIIAQCKELFGFDTWKCHLDNLDTVSGGTKFHIITMWDVIEHLEDPIGAVKTLSKHLTPDGVIALRTPNLMAFEQDILGDYYYSFKFDHVKYFSTRSLEEAIGQAGMKPVYVESTSHLFKGALSPDFMYREGEDLRGADIFGIYGLK
jgi:2-polyprenyl-3-methyl-5-hydroxy-6-metoxy-1,4-benzoquinol methylase